MLKLQGMLYSSGRDPGELDSPDPVTQNAVNMKKAPAREVRLQYNAKHVFGSKQLCIYNCKEESYVSL